MPRSIIAAGAESFAAGKASLLLSFANRHLPDKDDSLDVFKLVSYFAHDRAYASYALTTSKDTLALLTVGGQPQRRLLLPPCFMDKVVYGDQLEFSTETPRDLAPGPASFDVVMLRDRRVMPSNLAIGLGVSAIRDHLELRPRAELEALPPDTVLDLTAVRALFETHEGALEQR